MKKYAKTEDGKEALKKARKKNAQTKDGKEALKKAGKKIFGFTDFENKNLNI